MKTKVRGRLFLVIIASLVLCCNYLFSCRVFADDSMNDYRIELSPASKRVSLKPGEQTKGDLQLKNTGAKAVTVNLYAAAYYTDEKTVENSGDLNAVYTEMAEWITFKDDNGNYDGKLSFVMYPNQTMKIYYAIDVPSSAVGGGQYAIIFADFSPVKATSGDATIFAHSRVGMALFAFVDDAGIVRDARIDNVRALDGFALNRKIDVDYTIENTGNIDFQTSTDIVVSSIFGRELYHDIDVKTILPEKTEDIHVEWKDTPAVGIFRLNYTIEALNLKEEGTHVIFLISTGAICLFVVVLTITLILIVRHRKKKLWRKRRAEALKK